MTTTENLREYLDAHGIDGPPTEPGWYVVERVIYVDGDVRLAEVSRRGIECDGWLEVHGQRSSHYARHAPLTLAPPIGRDLDAETVAGVQAARKSIIRENAERDPEYLPYCGRCRGLVRMQRVTPFFWRCSCGAEHDERGDLRGLAGKGAA